jgi:hypothetical protein
MCRYISLARLGGYVCADPGAPCQLPPRRRRRRRSFVRAVNLPGGGSCAGRWYRRPCLCCVRHADGLRSRRTGRAREGPVGQRSGLGHRAAAMEPRPTSAADPVGCARPEHAAAGAAGQDAGSGRAEFVHAGGGHADDRVHRHPQPRPGEDARGARDLACAPAHSRWIINHAWRGICVGRCCVPC